MSHLPVVAIASLLASQYNPSAGRSAAPAESVVVESKDESGRVVKKTIERPPPRDSYGNAAGGKYDLAVDGAFDGQTIAVLHLYTGEGFDFALPKAALAEKGFSVYRWLNNPPSPKEFEAALAKSCQLWIISGSGRLLSDQHIAVIRRFFDSGRGVYIWGDNEPYYADANAVATALFDTTMQGNLPGDQTVTMQKRPGAPGLLQDHLITTGLEHVYEGITIATIQPNASLKPLIYGSGGNLVAAIYERDGKRAILDGGFTRLYYKWDTAGTARYVKNAAAWLANYERFGKSVISANMRTK